MENEPEGYVTYALRITWFGPMLGTHDANDFITDAKKNGTNSRKDKRLRMIILLFLH